MSKARGRPVKFESPDEMQRVIDSYFENDAYIGEGDSRIFAPTISGLALALGMSTEALRLYGHKDVFFATVKAAKQRVEVALEQRLYGQAVTGSIFNLKNNFGWKDKTEHDLSSSDGTMTPNRIEIVAADGNGSS